MWLSDAPLRDDKLLDEEASAGFLAREIVVEEKVDGANLGISFPDGGDPVVRNRGTVLGKRAHPQFAPFWPWLAGRTDLLRGILGESLILFGEWCYAVHSLHYDRLPDWFLAFDVYDASAGSFWSAVRRDELLQGSGIEQVPRVAGGSFDLEGLMRMLDTTRSAFGPEHVEGLYLRSDDGERLVARAKIVRPEFVQAIEEHWRNRPLSRNRIAVSAAGRSGKCAASRSGG